MNVTDVRSASLDELRYLAAELGFEKYRGKQIFEWINKKFAVEFSQMSNLPHDILDELGKKAYISLVKPTKTIESERDSSKKYLFELANNTIIENVLMKYSFGFTTCISSQAGCRMGCVFCASAKSGFDRDLTAGEMSAQVYEICKILGERISNVVIMGSGEPFDNYDNVIKFIRLINSPDGFGLGQRHITVSTCGIVPRIYDFADEGLQANLAVSLHAPDDSLRQRLMPVAKKYKIEDIVRACVSYSKKTGRRVTYEYALAAGINDSTECAAQLGHILKSTLSHVNLIPMNHVHDSGLKDLQLKKIKNVSKTAEVFAKTLKAFGVVATIRRKLGSDINASCGQLRSKNITVSQE